MMPIMQAQTTGDAGKPFGKLPIVDEILCSKTDHDFTESSSGASKVENLLGKPCRVLPNEGDTKYFGYIMGKGKKLQAGKAYLLTVEYPQDKARTIFIQNRGAEVSRAFNTGEACGDVLYTYTNNNNESIKIPLSGKMETWQCFFYLHDRFPDLNLPRGKNERTMTPETGFWVTVTQAKALSAPLSNGAAVYRIRLYEVPNPEKLYMDIKFPPADLPRRYLFWREEMSDGVLSMGHKAEEKDPKYRGLNNPTDWYDYKMRLARFLGMNAFCKDMLEFGANQGWDASKHGGNSWVWASSTPERWGNIVDMVNAKYKNDISMIPYYEYCGSKGQNGHGNKKRCRPLNDIGPDYTHIAWTEKANADITDPDTYEDFKKMLDCTVLEFKDKVDFAGIWIRPRPSQLPISFADATLERFAKEANNGTAITRNQLKSDTGLYKKYLDWWFTKRREFLVAMQKYLEEGGIKNPAILFTPDASEPGISLKGGNYVVTDDVAKWEKILSQSEHKKKPIDIKNVIDQDLHIQALLSPKGTWGKWEWQHSDPQGDPQNYQDIANVYMTYSFNGLYSVSTPTAFDKFRTPSGLAAIQHFPLNETTMDKKLGYFVCDVEKAGPYSLLDEARAMANGDPKLMGFLAGASFNRGFPYYARNFNAAFLSLPALPSERLKNASSDQEVVVRQIKTEKHGTYLAVINTGLKSKKATITLPAKGTLYDAPTGKKYSKVNGGKVSVSLYPGQMRSMLIK